ncbi:MAG: hypothetical protein HY744_09275 [Deltaproteobacteria bacterium]|nr:hypothetical protein [Deltaproteobacteria bacterium]
MAAPRLAWSRRGGPGAECAAERAGDAGGGRLSGRGGGRATFPARRATPTAKTISNNIKVCTQKLAWGQWNNNLITGGWTVCTLSQWAQYAPGQSPASFGLDTLWINNNACGNGQHHEVYVSYPMNDKNCYDGPNCCWGDGTVLQFCVCYP